jgi:hypothetical protein
LKKIIKKCALRWHWRPRGAVNRFQIWVVVVVGDSVLWLSFASTKIVRAAFKKFQAPESINSGPCGGSPSCLEGEDLGLEPIAAKTLERPTDDEGNYNYDFWMLCLSTIHLHQWIQIPIPARTQSYDRELQHQR